jgi:hypothetical protein
MSMRGYERGKRWYTLRGSAEEECDVVLLTETEVWKIKERMKQVVAVERLSGSDDVFILQEAERASFGDIEKRLDGYFHPED